MKNIPMVERKRLIQLSDGGEAYDHYQAVTGSKAFDQLKAGIKKDISRKVKQKDEHWRCRDLNYFRRHYLSRTVGAEEDQKDLCNFINLKWYKQVDPVINKHEAFLILVPPGWGKSHGYTIAYTLQQICLDRTKKILILSKSADKAKRFMGVISRHLLENKRMIRNFGEFWQRGKTWNTEEIFVKGCAGDATPSISHQGFYSQIESVRPNIIIMDDPIDDQTAISKVGVDHFLDTFHGTITDRLEPDSKLFIITHRFRKDDGLDKLIDNEMFKEDNHLIMAAEDKFGNSTCPERFDNERLRKKKPPYKPREFWEARFMQNPIKNEGCPFELDWILPPDELVLNHSKLLNRNREKWVDTLPEWIDITVDPAYTKSLDSDYTGMAILGPHPTDKHGIIIMGFIRDYIDSSFTNYFYNLATVRYPGTRKMFIEVNNAQTLVEDIKAKGYNKAIEVKARINKETRIKELSPCFMLSPLDDMDTKIDDKQRKKNDFRFYFHNSLRTSYNDGWEWFLNEYQTYNPNEKHDDHILDSLAQYIRVLPKHRGHGRMPHVG